MSEINRAMLVVLAIALVVFTVARAPMVGLLQSRQDFDLRRKVWFAITLALFLSHSFWIFSIVTALLLVYGAKKDSNAVAFSMVLLFAAPLVTDQVSGLGVVNYLVELNYFRLISAFVLLPVALRLRKEKGAVAFGGNTPEKFLIVYMVLGLIRQILVDSSTNTMRSGLYLVTDVVLPYYVASRSFKSVAAMRDAMASFVLAAAVVGLIGFFEFLKRWLLYSNIPGALGTEWGLGTYLLRGLNLRGTATTGQAIVLGYVMVVAMGFYLFVGKSVDNKKYALLGLAGLVLGLLAPLSRGPWVGAVLMLGVFVGSGPNALKRLAKAGMSGLVVFLLALASPYGPTIIDHLPFVGTLEADNVLYRERLFTNSMAVISKNLWFGSYDFMSTPEMLELKFTFDGGIIDLVNSYIAIALSGGITALAAFMGFFGWIVVKLYGSIKKHGEIESEMNLLQRSLFATTLAVLFMIATVSSISFIPIVYWLVAGLGMACLRLEGKQTGR